MCRTELQKEVTGQEKQAERNAGLDELRDKLESLEREKQSILERLRQLDTDKQDAKSRANSLQQQVEAVVEATKRLETDTASRIPRVKCVNKKSLYAIACGHAVIRCEVALHSSLLQHT